jgi:hypothetical protein
LIDPGFIASSERAASDGGPFLLEKESVNEIPEQRLNDTPLIEVVMSD